MTAIPNPKSVINSKAFRIWCEAVDDHLNNLEQNLIQNIAERQRRESLKSLPPRIIQSLAPTELVYPHLEEKWIFPMMDPVEFREKGLLFAPLSNTELDEISRGSHSYYVEDKRYNVRLVRSHDFFSHERKLSCYFGESNVSLWAKHNYLPELNFPFLPYSRKFIRLTFVDDLTNLEKKMILDSFTSDNLLLEHGVTGKSLGIVNHLIPVWNVLSDKFTAPRLKVRPDGFYEWSPTKNDKKLYQKPYIVHGAKDISGNPIKIVPGDITSEGMKIVSELGFHQLEYSLIENATDYPSILHQPVVGTEQLNPQDGFWYRQYLQTHLMSDKDIVQLLSMLPETRGKLRFVKSELGDASGMDIKYFKDEHRSFSNFTWYLNSKDLKGVAGADKIKKLTIYLEPYDSMGTDWAYLLEDIANYFASICGLYLPIFFYCKCILIAK